MSTELKKNDPAQARQYFADKLAFTTGPVEVARNLKQADIVVVDVREAEDYRKGHVPGAVNLPHGYSFLFLGHRLVPYAPASAPFWPSRRETISATDRPRRWATMRGDC